MVYKWNLALVHDPQQFGPEDYKAIAAEIRSRCDDIEIFIFPDVPGNRFPSALMDRPFMAFCPSVPTHFIPPRGKMFCGQKLRKDEQLLRLSKGGVRVPKWTYFRAGTRLSMMEWGDHVIVKPINFGFASKGRGVELVRTEYVDALVMLKAGIKDEKNRKYIIQKFIDSGSYSEDYRVLTLFGGPLYALKRGSGILLERPSKTTPRITSGVVSNADGGGSRSLGFCYEEDVLKFASTCYRAIPSVPLQAVDVRREVGTGRLYCLEINPGGLTWNFSSKRAKNLPLIDGIRREQQLGAWSIAAEALIEKVRLFAS